MPIRTICLLFIAALILGISSPYLVDVGPDTSRVLYAWLYWLPGVVSNWVWPESDMAFMALTMSVYTAQYFAVFMFLAVIAPLARDFLLPHKHRGRLIGRRA